jgi:uncharacterized membrane protein YhaH (DUF805 family)
MGGAMSAPGFDSMSPQQPAQPRSARLWTLSGRLGRAEYIVSSLGAAVLAVLCISLAGFATLLGGNFGRMVYGIFTVLLLYCLLPILFTILTIRRAHDFNRGGWLALLLLVPVLNLMFWFIPGTDGENGYGPLPQAPSFGLTLFAVLLPTLLIGGFIATPMELVTPEDLPVAQPAAQPANPLKPYQP